MTPDELLDHSPREVLLWLRGRLGYERVDLAELIGVSVANVVAWETRRRAVAPYHRDRLAPLIAPHLATDEGGEWLQALQAERERRRGAVPLRVFACVSDRWTDTATINAALDTLPVDTVILQAKPGREDNLAVELARERGIACEDYVPEAMDGLFHGRGVGRVLMWRAFDSKPDLVLAFRHGRSSGITGIIREARQRGLAVNVFDSPVG